MNKKILLVEDDLSLGMSLSERLSQDFEVIWAKGFSEAWSAFLKNEGFDLVILDVGLPDGDGFSLAEKILSQKKVLLLFLTAQADAASRLKGFEMGAQEFVPKPFHLKELLLRVHHVLETHQVVNKMKFTNWEIDFDGLMIQFSDGRIEYPSPSEMKALQILIEKSPRSVSRDEIIDTVWGQDKMPSPRSVDNIIVRLRQILKDEDIIRSVRGVGYQWSLNNSLK